MKKYNWKAVNKARACVQEEGHIIITTNAGLYRDEYHYLRGPVGQEQWCWLSEVEFFLTTFGL